jgi:HTH-type transcriptional regulator, sugar sensing transcriptional regulator
MAISSDNLLVKNLVEYGLSDKEAKMYLALLELEVATVNEAAKAAGVNRSSAYVVLEALKEKGLVSVSHDKKIQHYVATSPEALLYSAESQAQKQETVKNKIADIVPELKALHKDTKKRPRIMVYEGEKGIMNALNRTLESKEKRIRVLSSSEQVSDLMVGYTIKRFEKGIKMTGIHPDGDIARMLISKSPKNFDELALISGKEHKFSADIAIFDDKIGYISNKQKGISFIIESKDMAEAMKTIFDLAWKEARRIGSSEKKYQTD